MHPVDTSILIADLEDAFAAGDRPRFAATAACLDVLMSGDGFEASRALWLTCYMCSRALVQEPSGEGPLQDAAQRAIRRLANIAEAARLGHGEGLLAA